MWFVWFGLGFFQSQTAQMKLSSLKSVYSMGLKVRNRKMWEEGCFHLKDKNKQPNKQTNQFSLKSVQVSIYGLSEPQKN